MTEKNLAVESQAQMKQVATTFSLVPQSLRDAMELSKLIADSDLAPKDYRGKPGNVLIAVQMGQEVGLSPMTAIQSIAVINGKPSLYGDVGKAILLSKGFIIEEGDTEVVKKTGAGRCKITRPGHPPCERTFTIENAKSAGLWGKEGPWTKYKERQLAWRAFWFAARDVAADVLKGLNGAEEIQDLEVRDMGAAEVVRPEPARPAPDPYSDEKLDALMPAYTKLVQDGTKTPAAILATIKSKYTMTAEQERRITDLAVKPAADTKPATDEWGADYDKAAKAKTERQPGEEG